MENLLLTNSASILFFSICRINREKIVYEFFDGVWKGRKYGNEAIL
jgi:hypothetical protein